ncbi:bifunctional adenosylcobinamide kinase/adenosylcobinamide-phosphate guanylyltransferase [Schlegelella sp. S2-27]|uniref:Bifunctional adenosylcobalamin biosynthesis protein n=1 Tax=Caldimonas mangrovi TaxID=2944811 RepID=A0ABT0YNJ7_9BURK|nr:bifunctional adenosylcobinamide kinase/adenosylcobinamide-phosphate guanylyltransferase [Caldimonas mangrovi]MCM5680302.1 bifunctional adenosylcobinamide kinase/adenosylcobinamide-phosphate guanylyltransferase [Caldimonas mangrovi]
MTAQMHLILGAERSGKSRHAERLAREIQQRRGAQVVYLATAWRGDAEMSERIERHRRERPPAWQTIEPPLRADALAAAVREHARPGACVLIDCLTLWITQMLCPPPGCTEQDAQVASDALLEALRQADAPVLLVSNEIGWGVTPLGRETRGVVDALGRLHQRVAAQAERVTLMVAGLPMAVKPASGSQS